MAHPVLCKRCGSCCLEGGPALHLQDAGLIDDGRLTFDHLVTIRSGELAVTPPGNKAEPVAGEFLKLQGRQGDWGCLFYEQVGARCTIYQNRPVACRVLECSAPEALLTIVGKNLLTRFHCIAADDPLLPLVKEHQAACPCPDLGEVKRQIEGCLSRDELVESLQEKVDLDLQYRQAAASYYQLSVHKELFYFGRPLFQLLIPLGIRTASAGESIELF
ncbi:MAG: hypothetical protein CSA32_00715 [Desulfobulbus propionicus]|nr:MAG: hypothetical protein CSA32_00715 [Desulfobulbus propionicus]